MISIVIPLYNEADLLQVLIDEVYQKVNEIGEEFEVVCVDDGSSDDTLFLLKKIKKEGRKNFRVITLSRNYGHQTAFTAGMNYAKGEWVVLMDGDLQDPPEIIPIMYKKATTENFDIVIGMREGRNEKWLKRQSIFLFHAVFDKMSGLKDFGDSGNFCLMNREVVNALLQFKEKSRYLPGLRSIVGFKKTEVLYFRPNRFSGKAGMSTKKLIALAADAIFSFSKLPMKVCLWLGVFGLFVIICAIAYSLLSKFLNIAPLGWSSTVLSIYFLGAVQLVFLGVIGEYLYRIYKEVQNRPLYFAREIENIS